MRSMTSTDVMGSNTGVEDSNANVVGMGRAAAGKGNPSSRARSRAVRQHHRR